MNISVFRISENNFSITNESIAAEVCTGAVSVCSIDFSYDMLTHIFVHVWIHVELDKTAL
jgi:hypothetical protein